MTSHLSPGVTLLLALALAPAAALAQTPLDVNDPTPRGALVQMEISPGLATVGQSFGPAVPASWSVSGGVGTVVIPIESHEVLRTDYYVPISGTFTPLVIHIDLATLAATSEPASGATLGGEVYISFNMHALGTSTLAGFAGPNIGPLFCTSQQQLDEWCQIYPLPCPLVCTLVPGGAYDPATGKINLVGAETQSGCDGYPSCEIQTFTYFSQHGDLRLLEANVVPALPWPMALLLAPGLLAVAAAVMRRRWPA